LASPLFSCGTWGCCTARLNLLDNHHHVISAASRYCADEQAAKESIQELVDSNDMELTVARVVNGWSMNTDTMGVYGDYYLKRAIVALTGLGANQPEDAIYPLLLTDAKGKPLTGSLDLYFQHKSPGKDKESNWLSSPASGKLGITMRLYAPKLPALDGRWNPPAVKPVP
jgi:hypothetical protein